MINSPMSVNKKRTSMKTCARCNNMLGQSSFCTTKSLFFLDGYLPICNTCIQEILKENDFNWATVDKLCQYADIPFIPYQWEKAKEMNGNDAFSVYANFFKESEYENLDWSQYYEAFKILKENGTIEEELPLLDEQRKRNLIQKWGGTYSNEDFNYLETLLDGLLKTQNVNGVLQSDQAKKLCKISLELDHRIQEGVDFDKMLSSYDKLVKVAEFTPKNTKNINDLDSVGELFGWLEKRGYKCKFFDDVPKDIVDETLLNIQAWNQRLYTNESGIGDEITRRIEALKTATNLENGKYDLDNSDTDLDKYDNEGFAGLFDDDEDFSLGVD